MKRLRCKHTTILNCKKCGFCARLGGGTILKYSKSKRLTYAVGLGYVGGPDYARRINIKTGDEEGEKINSKQVPQDAEPLKEKGEKYICPVCGSSIKPVYFTFTYHF
jgi:predicted RNA-binding Zn-ribbon protein involved in translation (DUF1610 family)